MNSINKTVPLREDSSVAADSRSSGNFDRVLALRSVVVGLCFVLLYVVLDRTTVFLQIWSSISAWYPPVGVAIAL